METRRLFSFLLAVLYQCSSEEVFYVQPTGPTTECPSGDSPCHSLQYYANHSNFTNNSRFLFLEGEHHLDSLVAIRNVANLSLVGASSGVKILCKSLQSGLGVEDFTGLKFENIAISNCSGFDEATLYLVNGSEVSLNCVAISTSSGYDSTGLTAVNVVGLFSVFNSTFVTSQSSCILVTYSHCSRPTTFTFGSNKLMSGDQSQGIELSFTIDCSDIQILIMDSIFESYEQFGLNIDFNVLTNNSVLVNNSMFRGSSVGISICTNEKTCIDDNLHCSDNFVKFRGVTVSSYVTIDFIVTTPMLKTCTILIEDSKFSDFFSSMNYLFSFAFGYNSGKSINDTSIQAIFRDVIFANNSIAGPVCYFLNAAILFVNCTFENNTESAIQISGSKVIFQGDITFRNNSALLGGGMQLLNDSYMYLQPNTTILFEGNHAEYVGGAIYNDHKEQDPCFFHVDIPMVNTANIGITCNFTKNTANFSGSSLYGGGINSCICARTSSCANFSDIFQISNTEDDPSAIASEPYDLCLCDKGKRRPDCSPTSTTYSTDAYPGQEFSIRLAVVGASCNGVVPGAIRAYSVSPHNALGSSQYSQASDKPYCKDFNYSVSLKEKIAMFILTTERNFFDSITGGPESSHQLFITVHLMDCPLGFFLSPATGTCVCDPMLDGSDVRCNINNQTFLRPANTWIGFISDCSNSSSIPGVMFHPNCPIGYCLPCDVSITSNTSDSQCEPHRTGLLCGECEDGYSLTLGNGKCVECSNTYLLLILPLAVAGLFLVAILFALNLTVTEGSINGLIFYANVIGMNHSILTEGTSYLYTFLAWLNLDLGINTCLYNGMDAYTKIWLQFVFPIYLWVIILVIIQFYRKFPTLAGRLGGENAVKVLATLLLLSYTKLQRTVVTVMSFTKLKYPSGVVYYVWLYDANLEFFKGKHLYLIAGIIVLLL